MVVDDGTPPLWVGATVLTVLASSLFQARIVLPDGSDQWNDWFMWQEEGEDSSGAP